MILLKAAVMDDSLEILILNELMAEQGVVESEWRAEYQVRYRMCRKRCI